MDFTIVKIMNELGVSEEEARALVEFDLKHKKGEEIGKIEKSVVEGAGAQQLTNFTKSTNFTKNTKNTQNSKNTENTKNTISNAESVISNTEKVDNPIENTNHSTNNTYTNESIEPKLSDIKTNPTPKISAKEISETRNVEIFEFENENPKSKFKKQSFISEIENQILENYIGIEFPQNLNTTSVSFKVDGKYYTLKLTEHKSKPAGFKE